MKLSYISKWITGGKEETKLKKKKNKLNGKLLCDVTYKSKMVFVVESALMWAWVLQHVY